MSKQIEVAKVVLNINGKEISLTLDEAKELRNILDKAFPQPPVMITRIVERETPINIWGRGILTTPAWKQWEVTCGGSSGIGGTLLCCSNQSGQ